VAEHETLAGIALKYDISVEDIRRINSFLWTSNSVWVGQIIKVPVVDRKSGNENSETSQKQKTSKLSDQQVEKLAESSLKSLPKKGQKKNITWYKNRSFPN